jgi:hypothetical protein
MIKENIKKVYLYLKGKKTLTTYGIISFVCILLIILMLTFQQTEAEKKLIDFKYNYDQQKFLFDEAEKEHIKS